MNSLKEMPQNNEKLISNIRKITDLILSIRKDEKYSEFGLDFDNIEEYIDILEEGIKEKIFLTQNNINKLIFEAE